MKRVLSAVLAIIMLLSFCACAGVGEDAKNTVEVTDYTGRTVKVPENPERVVALYPFVGHTITMLGDIDKIVGASGIHKDVLIHMVNPEIANVPVPYKEGAINIEELAALDADVVFIRNDTAVVEEEIAKLKKLGVTYVTVDFSTIDELKEGVTLVGKVMNRTEEAQAYVDFVDSTLALVDERLEGLAEEDKVMVFHSVNEATRTDAEGDICIEVMERAGLKSASAENGLKAQGSKNYTTIEEIYNWDPDAIICNEIDVTKYILEDSKWAGLSAVANGKVYTLPVGATRWCHPSSMEPHLAVLTLAKMFYPERFEDIDLESYVDKQYKEFFGLELDDKTIKSILAGEGMRVE